MHMYSFKIVDKINIHNIDLVNLCHTSKQRFSFQSPRNIVQRETFSLSDV